MARRPYDAEIINSRLCTFTGYQIQVRLPTGSRVITRWYRDFERLRSVAVATEPRARGLPAMPPKACIRMRSASFRSERQEALARLLTEMVLTFPTLECAPLATFLGASADDCQALHAVAARASAPQATAAGSDASAAIAPGGPASPREAAPAAEPEALLRVQVLPLRSLPSELDGAQARLGLLRSCFRRLREHGTTVEPGVLLEGEGRHTFAVVKCSPDRGFVAASTIFFVEGLPLPCLQRVHFLGLKRHEPGDNDETLLSTYVLPHFRALAAEASRCALVASGEVLSCGGVAFQVACMEPSEPGFGVVDAATMLHAGLHAADECSRIHVVPFVDTLPSAYGFDLFADFVRPFFGSHRADCFSVGQDFRTNGVHFRVVAVEPRRPCRVGASTEIFCEGQLQPTVASLLTPQQAMQLAMMPPGIQMLMLQTDAFGVAEESERIVQAHARQSGLIPGRPSSGLSESALRLATTEETWSPEARERLGLDQVRCVVCLCDFQDGERLRRLPCDHMFHAGCVDECLGRDPRCPLCRHSLRNAGRSGRSSRFARLFHTGRRP
mmetsp:Transcript_82433/g.229726  ORF Transcript_82433/g.229726 Transcript_82433/m.229726 type:complete len:557 (-) Transcript_82433:83-1753(-)